MQARACYIVVSTVLPFLFTRPGVINQSNYCRAAAGSPLGAGWGSMRNVLCVRMARGHRGQ